MTAAPIEVTFDALNNKPFDPPVSFRDENDVPLYGVERLLGFGPALAHTGERVNFRLIDDDDVVAYEGTLLNDDEAENQTIALRWGEMMAGCTTIKVKDRDNAWTQEVG